MALCLVELCRGNVWMDCELEMSLKINIQCSAIKAGTMCALWSELGYRSNQLNRDRLTLSNQNDGIPRCLQSITAARGFESHSCSLFAIKLKYLHRIKSQVPSQHCGAYSTVLSSIISKIKKDEEVCTLA